MLRVYRLAILAALFVTSTLYGQASYPYTAKFPSSAATDADLLVALPRTNSVLASSITNSATSLTVRTGDGTKFAANSLITIDSEKIIVGGVSGNTLTSLTRGVGGTTAAPHTGGAIIEVFVTTDYHERVKKELIAIESNTLRGSATLVTSVGTPGLDTNVASEKAVRSAISNLYSAGNGIDITSGVISIKSGTVLPGTCSVGDVYNKTDATAGQNWYFCTATNTWTQQLNSGGLNGGSSDPATCTEGELFYNTTTHALKICTASNTWSSALLAGSSGAGKIDLYDTSAAGYVGWLGPSSVPGTSYRMQLPAGLPTNGQVMKAGTPSSGTVPMSWGDASAYYQTVQANGSAQTQRGVLNMIPGSNVTINCADNSGAGSTDCTVASGGAIQSATWGTIGPAATAGAGAWRVITDASTACTAGGGSAPCLVYSNGSSWLIVAANINSISGAGVGYGIQFPTANYIGSAAVSTLSAVTQYRIEGRIGGLTTSASGALVDFVGSNHTIEMDLSAGNVYTRGGITTGFALSSIAAWVGDIRYRMQQTATNFSLELWSGTNDFTYQLVQNVAYTPTTDNLSGNCHVNSNNYGTNSPTVTTRHDYVRIFSSTVAVGSSPPSNSTPGGDLLDLEFENNLTEANGSTWTWGGGGSAAYVSTP